ncbi:HD domain-containing protein [Pseudoruminococcus massiliensis]|uniref:HD domain-containing protein n=1 Tax=Pseudoruminococcus massiliensis TaxID=2086583 RepID=UPI0022E8E296|nr:hydrolase [Pseudoruminococcus massiliensis]
MTNKEEFLHIYNEYVKRQGSQEFLDWLLKTDFFTAPASTKYHGACEGGLLLHSLNVYKTLRERYFEEGKDSEESFAICALLHDLCKAQFYKVSTRNVKNDVTGQWEKVPYYTVEDAFPYGHGEKSVFLIERFMRLKTSEAMAIRWHMGGFDDSARGGSFAISLAYEKYPLAVKLHLADLESTYLKEKNTSVVRVPTRGVDA